MAGSPHIMGNPHLHKPSISIAFVKHLPMKVITELKLFLIKYNWLYMDENFIESHDIRLIQDKIDCANLYYNDVTLKCFLTYLFI